MKSLRETKEFMKRVWVESQCEGLQHTDKVKTALNSKVGRVVATGAMALCMAFRMATPAFAASGDDVFSNIDAFGKDLTSKIRGIAGTIALLCLVACGIMYMCGGQRTVENAKGWAVRILVAYAVVGAGTLIIDTVGTMTGGEY